MHRGKRKVAALNQPEDVPRQSKRLKAVAGLPGYCPPFNEEAVPEMMAISNQLNLIDCSPAEKESLLAKTFPWRRHLITHDNRPIRDVIRLFPGLFEEKEVCLFKFQMYLY